MVFRRGIVAVIAFSAITLAGCQNQSKQDGLDGKIGKTDAQQQHALTAGTTQLLTMAYSQVVAVSGDAMAATGNRDIQEDSMRWRINVVNRLDVIRAVPDPRVRFVALWTFITQMKTEFTTGFSKDRFGPYQPMYVKMLTQLDDMAADVAHKSFPPDVVNSLKAEIENLAKGPVQPTSAEDFVVQTNRTISRILAVPLAPVSGLQGVGDTPAAINRFTDQAGDLGKVVENLPERSRWQLNLLLLEAQHSGAVAVLLQDVEKIIAEMQQVSQEFAALSGASQKLPDQVNGMLQDVLKQQPELAKDLERIENSMKLAKDVVQQADKTMTTVDVAVVSAKETVDSVRQTLTDVDKSAAALQSTAKEVRGLIDDIKSLSPPPTTQQLAEEARKKQEGGGDTWTPAKIGEAAVQLQSAAVEVRRLLADIKSPTPLTGVEQTAQRMEAILYKALWGLAGLIAFFFACLLGYRIITRKMRAV